MVFDATTKSLVVSPPLTDFTSLGAITCKVSLKDIKDAVKNYAFTVTVTNTAPTFTPDPPATMSTPWKTATSLTLPAYTDTEGHACTYSATITNTFIKFTAPKTIDVNP
jgi:hypothetical protein